MMVQQDAPLLEKLLQTMEDARELLRRMHEAEKDLKRVIAEARGLHQEMLNLTSETIGRIIEAHAAEIKPAFGRALERALEQANADIDGMVNPLMQTLQQLSIHYEKLLRASEAKEGMLVSRPIDVEPGLLKSIEDAQRRQRKR